MSTKSLIIDSLSTTGKKLQKSMTFINPEVANSIVGGFATMANALTTNTYQKATIVKKMDVSEADSSASGTPTVTLDFDVIEGFSTSHEGNDFNVDRTETIEGGIRIYIRERNSDYDSADPDRNWTDVDCGYIDVTYTLS